MARRLLVDRAMEPLANDDRPRERLWLRGASHVSDEELITILLGSGVRDQPAATVARELVRATGGVAALARASPRELSSVHGVGEARAARVAAAFELGRRAVELVHRRRLVAKPKDVFDCVAARLSGLAQEVFVVIGIDVRNGLLDIVEVARGGVAAVEVHPREVFRPLIRMSAAGGLLVHNHPTGDPTPSADDVALTHRMRAAGDLIGVPIIDHIVIGERGFTSINEWVGAGSWGIDDHDDWPDLGEEPAVAGVALGVS